jgi:hypothetical protein
LLAARFTVVAEACAKIRIGIIRPIMSQRDETSGRECPESTQSGLSTWV